MGGGGGLLGGGGGLCWEGVKSPWQLRLLEACQSEPFVEKTKAQAAAKDVSLAP